MDTKNCSSCKKSKPSDAFLHPTKGTEGKTCAECIEKRSVASSRAANEQDKMQLTLSEHEAKLDDHDAKFVDHESRLQEVEAAGILDAASPRADLAEWMPLKDPSEPVGPGDLVEMVDKKISRVVTGRGRCFVVSTAPILTGNVPDDETLATGRAVAMIGQVPVKVVGAVRESQCLAASGRDDGTAAATDAPTGICSMETVAAAGDGSVRLVTALVNAGSHALSKTQKRREARKKKKSESFVIVGDDADAASDATTDLESLASTHACVQQLVDENRALSEQLGAFARRMRVLHVDPNILRRVARGWLARVRAARKLAAVMTVLTAARAALATRLLARLRLRRASAVVLQARARGGVCRATTLVGKLLHTTRRQAAALASTKAELASTKSKLSTRDAELATAKGEIAAQERELKSAVHASLCPAIATTLAVPVEGASALSRLASAVTKICKSVGKASVATAITKDLKVQVLGDTLRNSPYAYNYNFQDKKLYDGTIVECSNSHYNDLRYRVNIRVPSYGARTLEVEASKLKFV